MTLDFNKARHSVTLGTKPADSIIDDTSLGGDAFQDHWGNALSICFSENVLINNVRALDGYKHCIDVSSPKYRSSTSVSSTDFINATNLATSVATPQIYDTVSRSGTSSKPNGSDTITVTLSSHGFSVGDQVYLDNVLSSFDGLFEIQTTADANTFTVFQPASAGSFSTNSCNIIEDQGSRQVTLQNCYAKGAGDDNITTHFSAEVLITGCTSEYPCGKLVGTNSNCYEIDDGSRNVTLTDCTALGGCKGIQIKGHHYAPAPYNVTVDGVRIINCAQGLDIKHMSWGNLWTNTSTGGGTITNPAGQIKTGSITYTGGSPTAKNVSVSNVQIIAPRSVITEESNATQAVEEAVMIYGYENVVLNNIVINEGTNDLAGDYQPANGQSGITNGVVRVYLGAQNVSFNNLSIHGFNDAAHGFYVTSTILDHINVDGLIIQNGPVQGVYFQGASATPEASGSIDNFYINGNHSSTSGSKGLHNDLLNIRIGSGRVNGYETKFDISHNKGSNYPAFWGNQDTAQSIPNATYTALGNMGSNDHGAVAGEGGHFAESTGKFTVPDDGAGLYYFTAGVAMTQVDQYEIVRIRLYKNGSSLGPYQTQINPGGSGNFPDIPNQIQGIYKLAAGDYVEARVYHNEGSTESTNDKGCWFGGFRISSF